MKRDEGRKNASTESYNGIYWYMITGTAGSPDSGGGSLLVLQGATVVLLWNVVQACG